MSRGVGQRGTKSELIERRNKIQKLVLKGKSTPTIVSEITTEYGISKIQVVKDLTAIYKDMRTYLEKHKDNIIAEHTAKYDTIFEDAMELLNYRDALKALRQKEELLRYHRGEPLIAVQNNNFTLENVSDAELLKAITELKNKQQ